MLLHHGVPNDVQEQPRIVIIGAGGRLGAALARTYRREADVLGFNHQQLDLADLDELRARLRSIHFGVLINTAGQTNVDRCEEKPEEAFAVNAEAPRVLAEICSAKGARLIHISTDYVFDGKKSEPYTEEDEANPISVYGASKREGEQCVLAVSEEHLVARVSWVFGPDRPSFIDWVIGQAREHERVRAIADKISAPTYTLDIAEMLKAAFWRPGLQPGRAACKAALLSGLLHLANAGQCSWQEYGQWALDCCHAEGVQLRARTVDPFALSEMKSFVARRPIYTVLSTAKYQKLSGQQPRHWREAVAEYVRQHVKRV